jgi:hypothetical protein
MLLLFGISFYWFIAIESVLLFFLVLTDSNVAATVSLGIFALITHFLAHVDLISFVRDHWVGVVTYVLSYLVLGVVWSFAKWFFLVRDRRIAYQDFREKYFSQLKLDAGNLSHKERQDFDKACNSKFGYLTSIRPKASEYQGKIVAWIAYWPMSVVAFIFGDMLTRLFKEIYNLFAGLFQRISDSQFKGFEELHERGDFDA